MNYKSILFLLSFTLIPNNVICKPNKTAIYYLQKYCFYMMTIKSKSKNNLFELRTKIFSTSNTENILKQIKNYAFHSKSKIENAAGLLMLRVLLEKNCIKPKDINEILKINLKNKNFMYIKEYLKIVKNIIRKKEFLYELIIIAQKNLLSKNWFICETVIKIFQTFAQEGIFLESCFHAISKCKQKNLLFKTLTKKELNKLIFLLSKNILKYSDLHYLLLEKNNIDNKSFYESLYEELEKIFLRSNFKTSNNQNETNECTLSWEN